MSAGNIVVWEWLEDNDQWLPYDPETCHDIEAAKHNGSPSIKLGSNKVELVMYEIDFGKMVQRNTSTGRERDVKRSVLLPDSALAKGHTWDWFRGRKHTGIWTSYSTDLIEFLEKNRKHKTVDIPQRFNMPHEIDFVRFIQKNKNTNYERRIQRRRLSKAYPKDGAYVPRVPVPPRNSAQNRTTAHSGSIPLWNILGQHNTSTLPGTASLASPVVIRPHQTPQSSNYGGPHGHAQTSNPRPLPPVPVSTPNGALGGPVSNLTGATSSSGTKKKVKKSTQTHRKSLPPCPPGGIPCSSNHASSGKVPVDKVLKKFAALTIVDSKSQDHCAICQSLLTDESGFSGSQPCRETMELNLCNHVFHTECIKASYEHSVKNGCIICPACNKMHGVKTGNQPPGTMYYDVIPTSLPGHPGAQTIEIAYLIHPGTQTSEHPHPGRPYRTPGFPRIAYLPDNDDGTEILSLLIEAWKRRLIFTVGQSSTSGHEDCVTWTGIHHKTEMQSRRGHGYPDPGYFDRVRGELAAEGVGSDNSL